MRRSTPYRGSTDQARPLLDRPVFLTVGNFDGVHRGHQALITEMVGAAHAAGCLAGLLTFDPHPLAVLRPETPIAHLTTIEERAEILAALGLDFVAVLPFTRQVAATPAADFMRQLTGQFDLRELWIGPDFALGRGREGSPELLAVLGAELGYGVHILPPYNWQGEPVRSSRVRALLAQEGAVDQAAALLGRPYQVWGEVQQGAQRGRKLGFPTVNLALPADRLTPTFGVYACWAWHEDRGYPAAVNIGVRPSFGADRPTVEAYLLDFEGDLYGERVGLSFIRRLRGEQRFPDVPALVAQIQADATAARRILADPPDDTHAPDSPELEATPSSATAAQFWAELPHTADLAIRVWGDSQRQLFARAAAAMYRLQEADTTRSIALARMVKVSGSDEVDLLVAWLNRLLLGQELNEELYTRFEIHELSAVGLRGVAYGYGGYPAHTAIKAATYHNLRVEATAEGWVATVTFDV